MRPAHVGPIDRVTAEVLAECYRAEKAADPERATVTEITDVIRFAPRQIGQDHASYGRRVGEAGDDVHAALRPLPKGEQAGAVVDAVTGRITPFDALVTGGSRTLG